MLAPKIKVRCYFATIIHILLTICHVSSQEEKPLEFEDIVDKRTYDKMRPPKPEGRFLIVVTPIAIIHILASFSDPSPGKSLIPVTKPVAILPYFGERSFAEKLFF